MSTEVTRRPAPGKSIDLHSFADITSAKVTSIDWVEGGLQVVFDADLTPAEIAAVRRRIVSDNSAEEQLREQAEAFIAADPTTVTPAQLVRVVQRLARLVIREL